jgi:hypothetical protein
MGVTVTTDHVAITSLLDEFLDADPVRGTVLGTIRSSLEETAWAATDAAGRAGAGGIAVALGRVERGRGINLG